MRTISGFGVFNRLQLHWRHALPVNNVRLTLVPCVNENVRTKTTKPDPDYQLNETALAAAAQAQKGKIYDKKPFKFTCTEGKAYSWCSCGWSKSQPFCDGTHKNPQLKITLKPLRFIAPETKEYIFCNCKQTSKRPFCDGTHKRDDIQAAIRS